MGKTKDVRLVTLVTSEMDDELSSVAKLQGLSKSDIVRSAIGTYLYGLKMSVSLVAEMADLSPEERGKLRDLAAKMKN